MPHDSAGRPLIWQLNDDKLPLFLHKIKNQWYIRRIRSPLWKGYSSSGNQDTYNEVLITRGDFRREEVFVEGNPSFKEFKELKTHYLPGVVSVPTFSDDANINDTTNWTTHDPLNNTPLKWRLSDFQSVDNEELTITTVTITWTSVGCPFELNLQEDPCTPIPNPGPEP